MKFNFFSILFWVFTVQSQAQIVVDIVTREPMPGAHVFIYGTSTVATTNKDGIFDFERFPNPPFQIHISMVGYETGIFDILEFPKYGMMLFLLEQEIFELSETAIRGRRIRHPGCNINKPGFGWDLGVVDRGGERTITRTVFGRNFTQTWSYPVTASNCQKEAFDGGSRTSLNADCRSNPSGFRGDFFSWCAVMRYAEVLCPYPWRVPTVEDFMRLSNALCGNEEGSYFIFPQRRQSCHSAFFRDWGGLHHGFSNPSGKVYERGRLVYYWEILIVNTGTWQEDEESRWLSFNSHIGWQSFEPDIDVAVVPAYRSGLAVHKWSILPVGNLIWRSIALDRIHNKNEVAFHLEGAEILDQDGNRVMDWTSFSFVEQQRESSAVYYWSQSTHGTWQAFVLGLSADRDPTYARPLDRERNRDRHRWGYYSVLPQLIIDKRFGLTLRCVK